MARNVLGTVVGGDRSSYGGMDMAGGQTRLRTLEQDREQQEPGR
jgi:hypothetical protein